MNISHGEFLMLGAFLTWSAHTLWGCISPLLLMPLAFIALFALGVVVHASLARLAARAPNVDVFEARSLMVGFGLMFWCREHRLLIWGGDLRGYEYLADPVQIAGMRFTENKLVLFGVALALVCRFDRAAQAHAAGQSRAGADAAAHGRAAGGHQHAAPAPDDVWHRLGLSGVAGALLSMTYEISPSMASPTP